MQCILTRSEISELYGYGFIWALCPLTNVPVSCREVLVSSMITSRQSFIVQLSASRDVIHSSFSRYYIIIFYSSKCLNAGEWKDSIKLKIDLTVCNEYIYCVFEITKQMQSNFCHNREFIRGLLKLPLPKTSIADKIYFTYILKSERSNPLKGATGTISDFSNVPYEKWKPLCSPKWTKKN